MKKIIAVAIITFLEGIRNRSVYGIALFALFVFGLNIAVGGFFMRDVGKVTVDMNLSALSFAGLLLVFFVGLNLISKDIDKKSIQIVLSKPISREVYVWGKFIGIQMFVWCSLLVLIGFSSGTIFLLEKLYAGFFLNFSWLVFFVACFFVLVKLGVVSAMVIFFSSMTSNSFIALLFSICFYLVGEVIEDVLFYLRSSFAAQEVPISDALGWFIDFVSYLVPNFSAFDFKVDAAYGFAIDWGRVGLSFGYGVVYIFLLLLFGAMIFRRREFN